MRSSKRAKHILCCNSFNQHTPVRQAGRGYPILSYHSPPRPSPQIIHGKTEPLPALPCHQQRVALPNPKRSSDLLGDNHSAQFVNPAYDTCCPHRPCLLDGVRFSFFAAVCLCMGSMEFDLGVMQKNGLAKTGFAAIPIRFLHHSCARFKNASACRRLLRNAGRSRPRASVRVTHRCSNISSCCVSTSWPP